MGDLRVCSPRARTRHRPAAPGARGRAHSCADRPAPDAPPCGEGTAHGRALPFRPPLGRTADAGARRTRGRTGAAVATATFVVGALPWLAGVPLLSEPFRVRRERLTALGIGRDHLVAPAPLSRPGAALLAGRRPRRPGGGAAQGP